VARSQYEWVEQDPFTLFFHPSDPLKYFNYAIPNRPCGGDLGAALTALRGEYQRRQRVARFEFFEAFAPELPAILRQHRFVEEGRQWGMICTRQTFQPAAAVPGLSIAELGPQTTLRQALDFHEIQQEAFSEGDPEPLNPEQAAQAQLSFARRPGFLARLDGEAVCAGSYSLPIAGVTEIAGIATRPAFRQRGIATALTAQAVAHAFDHGVEVVYLTAEDERAGRVYQRVGFIPFSIMLAYIDGGGV
jgi:ribosomal protein S18 acetylase RimI-like enzyme